MGLDICTGIEMYVSLLSSLECQLYDSAREYARERKKVTCFAFCSILSLCGEVRVGNLCAGIFFIFSHTSLKKAV